MKFLVPLLLLSAVVGAQAQVGAPKDPSAHPPPPEITPAPSSTPMASPVNPDKPAAGQPARKKSEAPAVPPLDALSGDAIRRALAALQGTYVEPAALSGDNMARATLQGLLDRLSPSISLSGSDQASEPAAPFYSEVYQNGVGYVRVGELSKAHLAQTEKLLKDWNTNKTPGVVLDLRGSPAQSDFEGAAALAAFFCPRGRTLFTLQAGRGDKAPTAPRVFKSSAEPLFTGLLIVLVDAATGEAPEAAAGSLRATAKALLVGDKTSGKAFQYNDLPLENGMTLRVAVARVSLGNTPALGDAGLKPDIAVGLPHGRKQLVMQSITGHGLASVLAEKKRVHLSEASLNSQSNPDIDTMEADQAAARAGAKSPLVDAQLRAALDLVTSITLYQKKEKNPFD